MMKSTFKAAPCIFLAMALFLIPGFQPSIAQLSGGNQPYSPYPAPVSLPPEAAPGGHQNPNSQPPAAQQPSSPSSPGFLPTKSPTFSPVPSGQTGSSTAPLPFDPLVDNHLVSPETPIGLFGRPVGQVEEILRGYGAKPYSYAFGKYSRYIISVYELTLHIDRFRRLAGVDIAPRPPFERVDLEAQKFFLRLFFQGQNMECFRATIQDRGVALRYSPP